MLTVNVCCEVVPKALEPVTDPFKVPPPTSLEPDIFLLKVIYPELSIAKSEDGLTAQVTDWLAVTLAVVPSNPDVSSYILSPLIADSIA